MQDDSKHLSDLDAYLTLKNYSKATRRSYGSALRRFLVYREREGIRGAFSQEQARAYILCRYDQGLKWQTINGDYSSLHKFYKFVLGVDWDVHHIPRPRKERSLPRILSQEEVCSVINHGRTYKHQVFMTLLYSTGLRLSEALNLKLTDIDGDRLQLRVLKGKGAKDRYVQFPQCLLELLRDYYRFCRPQTYLFEGKYVGCRWATRSVQWAIKRAQSDAGVSRQVSAHVFRHCYATHHLERGTNMIYLKEQMGHKHLKTTARYIHLCKTYHRQVHHPIADMEVVYRKTTR